MQYFEVFSPSKCHDFSFFDIRLGGQAIEWILTLLELQKVERAGTKKLAYVMFYLVFRPGWRATKIQRVFTFLFFPIFSFSFSCFLFKLMMPMMLLLLMLMLMLILVMTMMMTMMIMLN